MSAFWVQFLDDIQEKKKSDWRAWRTQSLNTTKVRDRQCMLNGRPWDLGCRVGAETFDWTINRILEVAFVVLMCIFFCITNINLQDGDVCVYHLCLYKSICVYVNLWCKIKRLNLLTLWRKISYWHYDKK